MRIVNKTQLASLLNVSKSRVSQYVRLGMPVRADGLVDADAAAAWVSDRIDPAKDPTMRAARPHAPAVAVPSASGGVGFPEAMLKVLTELPCTIALAVADAGGTRQQAEHAIRVVLEVVHDELTLMAERRGVPGAPGLGWRVEAERLVRQSAAAVRWPAYFAPDGRSTCTGEIYSSAFQ